MNLQSKKLADHTEQLKANTSRCGGFKNTNICDGVFCETKELCQECMDDVSEAVQQVHDEMGWVNMG